jgi:hypothetical protein
MANRGSSIVALSPRWSVPVEILAQAYCNTLRFADGTYNPDTNPSRIRPRNLVDVSLGADSIWRKDRYSLGAKLTVVNLMDKVALYNVLSSFSGTHFVTP